MVGPDQLLGFGVAALVLIVIPGPSVVFVVGRAVSYGQRAALASVVGNTAGLFLVMTLVAVGLGAVVAESMTVFTIIKLAGVGSVLGAIGGTSMIGLGVGMALTGHESR